MSSSSPLENKVVLLVDDEPDILESVSEELGMCLVHKADNFETARQHLLSYTYDLVVLDIMGVKGFELLKLAVAKGFPTIMLTAHALTPEALKKSIKLGAVSFVPKEKISELRPFLEEMLLNGVKTGWSKLWERLGSYFNVRFGPGWREKDKFLKDFFKELEKDSSAETP
ncbi:MAG TPA: response regulator [Desulfobacteria bacterium]|nr:response regulator [Desulfobacteria bacterium]